MAPTPAAPPAAPVSGPTAHSRTLPQVNGHLEALDGLRALAALMVLVFHVATETGDTLAPGVVGGLLSAGDLAVPLFFALSGVLLYRPWARAALDGVHGPSVGAYLWRRGARVMPAYWLVALVALLLWSREHLDSVRAWAEVMTLTFTYNTDPWWVGTGPYGLGQMWSLAVEVSFYLLLPLFAFLLALASRGGADADARGRRLLLGLLAMALIGVLALVPQFYPEPREYMHAWLPRTLGMFAAGMALAVLSEWAWRESGSDGPVRRFCRTLPRATTLCWLLAGAFYLLAATPAAGGRFIGAGDLWTSLVDQVAGVGFAFFIVAPVALLPAGGLATASSRWRGGAWLGTLLTHKVSRFLGKISYGIFLWQFIVLYLWREFTGQEIFTGSFWLDIVPVTAVTILLAWPTYHWVEEPCRRWTRRVRSGRAKADPA